MVAVPNGKFILASDVVGVDAEREIAALARENVDLRAKLTAAEKARDEQAEAVRVLAKYTACKLEGQRNHIRNAVRGSGVLQDWQKRTSRAQTDMMNNLTAAAAVKEAGK
jgi:hypothetical protein